MRDLHPVHQTHDATFNTVSGKTIKLFDIDPDQIDIKDIAHALSLINRFGGHTPKHYSVAQHSLFAMKLADHHGESLEVRLACLMHDAAEAYVGDVIKPLKNQLGKLYHQLEIDFERVIEQKYDLDFDHKLIKKYDMLALEIEHTVFFKGDTHDLQYLDFSPVIDGEAHIFSEMFLTASSI